MKDFAVYEYLDGVCNVMMYHHRGEWHISAGIEADNPKFPMFFKSETDADEGNEATNNNAELTDFATFFWRTFHELGYHLPSDTSKYLLFVFG